MTFDKKICISNIRLLAKNKGINIGELETGAGVSAGYLSRISKDESKSSPSIEVLTHIAEKLDVSLDSLITIDYSGLSPNEKYIVDFVERLISKTKDGVQNWDKETYASFAKTEIYNDGQTGHPLFVERNGRVYFNSYFAEDINTNPGGDFFKTSIESETLYLAKLSHENCQGYDYEIYFVSNAGYNNEKVNPVCGTNPTTKTYFDVVLSHLYEVVQDACRNIKITGNVRGIIDRFMNPDDFSDSDLPF